MKMDNGKPETCTHCGSSRISDILYGLPGFSDKLQNDLDESRVVLGGCMVREDNPKWACADCGTRYPMVDGETRD